jgi:hypothetical protein
VVAVELVGITTLPLEDLQEDLLVITVVIIKELQLNQLNLAIAELMDLVILAEITLQLTLEAEVADLVKLVLIPQVEV